MNNFWTRTLSALVFGAVMVFGIIWDRTLFGALFVVILWMALQEFYRMALGMRFQLQQKLGLLTGALSFFFVACHVFYGWPLAWLALPLLLLLLLPGSCLLLPTREHFEDLSIIYTGLLYIALPITLSPLIMMDGEIYDGWLMLCFFLMIWASDIGAYCIGTLLGQGPKAHKLAPTISPKKSWWGFGGGLFFGVGAAIGLYYLGWLQYDLVHCIILGVIISVFGVCGDLFESMWKRHFGVKDSGHCIPGHGGMLDRFDSSLVAIPMACIYLALIDLI